MDLKKGTLRQVLLITDGCSNHGEDPIAMAALAKEHGITVNVIGILEERNEEYHRKGLKEVEEIAMAGGGVSQIVYTSQLSQTVQMVTRKGMAQTIQGVINSELSQILGKDAVIEDLAPQQRGEVMEVADDLGETMDLEVLILVDASGSMEKKLATVQESLIDLSISLNARMGFNQFSLYAFPGKREECEQLIDWTPRLNTLSSIFSKLSSGGITPTGPALKVALAEFTDRLSKRRMISGDEEYIEGSGF
ncbi:hypothetical protein A374_16648 [Fictibacillus macauensis ZFHKF-1]|uniref:VWFA domain-containing protein n=1 Tax=Fictibacillus macauensis ZFHKF-1 TaxID=1196324 RepID=I8IXG1_9BACL|nr:VWA domain-containing protein [Fictibacillus macauensis]EIT84171.1 hypothetical protein A374_16648 [Fictibacillus macauensis ZFHKF-1]